MLLRVVQLIALAALGAAAVTDAAAQQDYVPQSKLTGSARITGRVIAKDDGKPVRRAAVYLSGRPDSEPDPVRLSRTVETDVDGRFDFVNLPPGVYAILFSPVTGFVVPPGYKQTTLTETQTVDMTVRLERTGAIEGRILDENGDPILRAEVLAVARVEVAGHAAWGTSRASATTNDRGEFRVFGLPAGEYDVTAGPARSGLSGPRPFATHQPPPPPVDDVTTYYPGSTRRADARPVAVRAGRDTERVTFRLARRRLATLSITAVDSRGLALGREAHASLNRRDAPDMSSSSHSASRAEAGRFLFAGVEPGDYFVVIATSYKMEEAAYVNVSVNETDVPLNIQTNTGAKVSGRVTVDGRRAEGGPGLPDVWVSADTPPDKFGPRYAQVASIRLEGTDRFELSGLRGPMRLSGNVSGGAPVSIRRRGEELLGKTVEFVGTESLDDVVVEVTTQVAKLEVTVPRSNVWDEVETVVFIFPEDPQQWRAGFAYQVRTTDRHDPAASTPAADRTAELRVLPGRYLVAAFNTAGVRDPSEPALLEKIRPLATPVTLVAGETTRVTIPVAKARR